MVRMEALVLPPRAAVLNFTAQGRLAGRGHFVASVLEAHPELEGECST